MEATQTMQAKHALILPLHKQLQVLKIIVWNYKQIDEIPENISSNTKHFHGATFVLPGIRRMSTPGDIRIFGIGLELACNWGSCGEYENKI